MTLFYLVIGSLIYTAPAAGNTSPRLEMSYATESSQETYEYLARQILKTNRLQDISTDHIQLARGKWYVDAHQFVRQMNRLVGLDAPITYALEQEELNPTLKIEFTGNVAFIDGVQHSIQAHPKRLAIIDENNNEVTALIKVRTRVYMASADGGLIPLKRFESD